MWRCGLRTWVRWWGITRGRRMFGVADHDASTIEELLGGIPLAGFFAAGEIGPIAGRNALHGFTASMALFVDDME